MAQIPYSIYPFQREELAGQLDPSKCSFLEIDSTSPLYATLSQYVAVHSTTLFTFTTVPGKLNEVFDPRNQIKKDPSRTRLIFGLGIFKFVDPTLKSTFILLHHAVGKPVGSNRGAIQLKQIIIFVEGRSPAQKDLLQNFCNAIIEWEETSSTKTYKIFSWHHNFNYWQETATKLLRPVDSVILPANLKNKVLEDVDEFVSADTAAWYSQHGIPYKRSFLFHGPPGAGKSSLISVIAGHLGRNLCFLQPSDPKMTDENLSKCLFSAPKNSVIVIEDIDALFGSDRQTTQKTTPLTFSGLLNGLDGVANPDGQVFILTTNYIDRLDPALIRAGRVDVKIEFPFATAVQVEGMFLRFYPNENKLAKEFTELIAKKFNLEGNEQIATKKKLTMAQLQQHFISCRKASAEEAVKRVENFEVEEEKVPEKKVKEEEDNKEDSTKEKEKVEDTKGKEKESTESSDKDTKGKEKETTKSNDKDSDTSHKVVSSSDAKQS